MTISRPRNTVALRYAVIGLVVGVMAAAVPAAGLFGQPSPPRPQILYAHAAEADAIATSSNRIVSLSVAPTDAGGECLLLNNHGSTSTPRIGNAGGICTSKGSRENAPLSVVLSWLRNLDGTFDVIVAGRVTQSSGIRTISISPRGMTGSPVRVQHGAFLVSLPSVLQAGSLPEAASIGVGYDRAQREVAQLDLRELLRAAQPG